MFASTPPGNVVAVVVTYRPDIAMLTRLLDATAQQVSRICIVDNTDDGSVGPAAAAELVSAHLIKLGFNAGIAKAQNDGIEWALAQGAEFVMLMDQDSVPLPGMVEQLLLAAARHPAPASFGPTYHDPRSGHVTPFTRIKGLTRHRLECEGPEDVIEVDHLIASGCLIPAGVLRKVGLMRAELFIDYVDIEWGLRASHAGFPSFGVCAARMEHSLGDSVITIRGRKIPVHNPLRHYYQVRNAVLCIGEPVIPMRWKLLDVKRIAQMIVLFSVLTPPRWKHFRMMMLGLWDGLRKRTGRFGGSC